MLKIRLARAGKKNSPFFRLVLTEDSAAAKHGYKEILGFFNPMTKEFKINDLEKIKKYISNGAQFSDRVVKLMKMNNISL